MDEKEKAQLHHEEKLREDMLRERQHAWWRQCMRSPLKHMAVGAQRIAASMSWSHGDNWRRKNIKKPGK